MIQTVVPTQYAYTNVMYMYQLFSLAKETREPVDLLQVTDKPHDIKLY